MLTKLSAALAVICMLSGASLAQEGAKPTDPQIAHIAYTAGESRLSPNPGIRR
jgi:putative membrane protein